jgi:hypothetical protein
MSRTFTFFCGSLFALSTLILNADAPLGSEEFAESAKLEPIQFPIEETPVMASPALVEAAPPAPKKVADKTPEVSVNPFTGKIKGRKVRMRLRADTDSRIIKELAKDELVTIVGEKGDFWAVQPPAGTKAYIFRSFVLDNIVEGNKVNVRLEPSLDAPVIAHMMTGEKLENSIISPINTKWLEIAPPSQTRFYIAKEYIEYAGGPEVKEQMDRRLAAAENLLDATATLGKAELRKPFEEVDFDRIVKGYNTVVNDYADFTDLAEQAKESLAAFQEAYLQKRISYLENHPFERSQLEGKSSKKEGKRASAGENFAQITDKMKLWDPIEESLYLSWANINDNKSLADYYEEQKLSSVELAGIVEPYNSPAKNKPGDFIIRDKDKDMPIAYIYSNQINLQNLAGKHVTLVAVSRPNNNFAFPAYFVLSVE